ncbi:methyl-accepting chemotaxis protein [Shewanella canadensis]|nr:methyl-accepting chemotaxis protein [Shewanella canadensis]
MSSMSIRRKFALTSFLCLFTSLSILMASFLYYSSQTQALIKEQTSASLRSSTESFVAALANEQSEIISAVIEHHLVTADTMAHSIMSMRSDAIRRGSESRLLRMELNDYTKKMLEHNGEVLGIYIVMSPDTLGADSAFIENVTVASNGAGRFAPYWARVDGQIELEVMLEEDITNTQLDKLGLPDNEWVTCAIERASPCLLDPYLDKVGGKPVLMTSITVPLIADGKTLGMLGLDVSLSSLQPIIETADKRLLNGSGEVVLSSQRGVVAAYSSDRKSLGEKISSLELNKKAKLGDWHEEQKSSIQWSSNGEDLVTLRPITFDGLIDKWGLILTVPVSAVLADSLALEERVVDYNRGSLYKILLSAIIITVISLFIVWRFSFYLIKPLNNVTERLQSIASGEWDLTQRIKIDSYDEIGTLTHWFNQFLEKLQTTVKAIDHSIKNGQSTSSHASDIAGRTSLSSQQQFSEVDQVAAAIEQMSTTAGIVSEKTLLSANAANDASLAAEKGRSVANQTSLAVESLVEEVSAAMPLIEKLNTDSANIEKILSVIQGIAEQTNLLALNAAIEAARAGEQGRGFAVVANEVRDLAERTKNSIGQISQVTDLFQSSSQDILKTITAGNDKAINAVSQVKEMAKQLADIEMHIRNITENEAEIAKATAEQSSVATEISYNIANIKEASQHISREAESSATLSDELKQLATGQQQIVSQFKV